MEDQTKQIELLNRALSREKMARSSAESLLEEKSRSLFESNAKLQSQFEELAKKTSGLEFLHSVASIIRDDTPFEEALKQFLEAVCKMTKWPLGHAYIPKANEALLVSSKIWFNNNESKFVEFKKISEEITFKPSVGLPGRAYASGSAIWIPDVSLDDNFPRSALLKEINIRSAFAIPVEIAGKVMAVVEFFAEKIEKKDQVLIDIIQTAAVQLGALLGKQQTQLQLIHNEKMASLGEMAGGMAHEINTPLGAITLSASQLTELLPKNIEQQEIIVEIIQDILESAERISRIVRGLKNFSRDTTKGGEFVFADFSVILQESLALCEVQLKNHAIRLLLLECSKNLDIQCNPSQLSQVVVNLINNAKDAILNLNEKWIEVSLKDMGYFAELRITDSGSGIPKEIIDKLFQPFFTTKKIGSGTGLGLSIIHGIVKAHSGKIIVDTNHKNTSFVVQIPKIQSFMRNEEKK